LYVLFILVKFHDTKGETEAVNQRTNNIMVNRKQISRTNNDLQHTTHKTKEQHELRQNRGASEELAVPILLMAMPPISAMRTPAVTEK
jgi:hypothetical protein